MLAATGLHCNPLSPHLREDEALLIGLRVGQMDDPTHQRVDLDAPGALHMDLSREGRDAMFTVR